MYRGIAVLGMVGSVALALSGCSALVPTQPPVPAQPPAQGELAQSLADFMLAPEDLPGGLQPDDLVDFTEASFGSSCQPATDFETSLSFTRDSEFVSFSSSDDDVPLNIRQGIYVLDEPADVERLMELVTLTGDGRCDDISTSTSTPHSVQDIDQIVPLDANGLAVDFILFLGDSPEFGSRTFVFDFEYTVVVLEVFATEKRYELIANEIAERLWSKLSGD